MNSASDPDKRTKFSSQYQTALKAYLVGAPGGTLESARELGKLSVSWGLDTLDIARIHDSVLTTLAVLKIDHPAIKGGNDSSTTVKDRAVVFFAEALIPIEQSRSGAREINVHLSHIVNELSQRTLELADSNEELRDEIRLRKSIEDSLRTSEKAATFLLEQSRLMQEELRQLSRQLLSVQEEERRRISRELHDVIAQTLAGITLQLATLTTNSTAGSQEFQKKITEAQRTVEHSVDIMHRFARELRPSVLDDLGLIPALRSYLKTYVEETGIRVKLTAFAKIEQCDGAQRTALYRIAQEALTNINRHARATEASIKIMQDATSITMTIIDNGQGFAVEPNGFPKSGTRLGLLGMRERIEMVGGTFSLQSTPQKGTTVNVTIPTDTESLTKLTSTQPSPL